MSKYRIVSIDGGGIRGLITTVLFQRLTAIPGLEKILDKADLVRHFNRRFVITWYSSWN
mgnify:CR=1 FL=1